MEKEMLMLNDILCDGSGHTGRVIALSEDEFLVRADGDEWDGEDTRPMFITDEWILASKVHDICFKNDIILDFSRKHKLKLSVVDSEGRIVISYFFPMPKYVHELQHILRYFNRIEI